MRAALLAIACVACAGAKPARPPPTVASSAPPEGRVDVDKVLDAARAHLGKTTVRVNGRSFRYDCSGFVRGMFWAAGIDLMSEPLADDDDNGVRIIFKYVDEHGRNHRHAAPQRGDVVYFDNTWDRNGNGKLDDPLTHIGIVEDVGADGELSIIHRANRGIVRDQMNLLHPHDEKRNAYLRPKGRHEPHAAPHLMSELFAGFGTVEAPALRAGR